MSQRPRRPAYRRPRDHLSGDGAGGPDGRAVGGAGTAAAFGKEVGRPPKWTKRQLIDGIRWRVRAGAPWRDVPLVYGPWQTVYGLFRRWQRDGTWAAIVTGLQARADAAGLITWEVSVDSTVARAHQHAAGARNSIPHHEANPRRSPTTRLRACSLQVLLPIHLVRGSQNGSDR